MDRWARLAAKVGRALLEFAEEGGDAAPPTTNAAAHNDRPAARGHRQRQILALDGLATDRGLTTGEIADLIAYEQPNVYNTLQVLQGKKLVELIVNSSPQRWRAVVA